MMPQMVGVAKNLPAVPFGSPSRSIPRRVRFCRPAAASGEEEKPALAAVPESLRAIQRKRKLAAAATGAAGGAVAALAAALEAVQGAAEAARCAGDAVAWVLRKVHFESPELVLGLLGLVASGIGTAVEREMERIKAQEAEATAEAEPNDGRHAVAVEYPLVVDLETELWARIGILHGVLHGDSEFQVAVEEKGDDGGGTARTERRKAAYERLISTSEANSLVLSNYAQLLYQHDKDLDSAEEYFKRAVAAEPEDGEARSRYAMFLWNGRGDLEAAETMFLEAIDAEPESNHHRSSYAWFLWTTGGPEFCIVDGNTIKENDVD